jgi:hypothetical protein
VDAMTIGRGVVNSCRSDDDVVVAVVVLDDDDMP